MLISGSSQSESASMEGHAGRHSGGDVADSSHHRGDGIGEKVSTTGDNCYNPLGPSVEYSLHLTKILILKFNKKGALKKFLWAPRLWVGRR